VASPDRQLPRFDPTAHPGVERHDCADLLDDGVEVEGFERLAGVFVADLPVTVRAFEVGQLIPLPGRQHFGGVLVRDLIDFPCVRKAQQEEVAGVAVVRFVHGRVPARATFAARMNVGNVAVEDVLAGVRVHVYSSARHPGFAHANAVP
jgi:hypothetical protein